MDFSENKITTVPASEQGILFNVSPVSGKRIEVSFSGSDISSDGGLLLLKECEQQTGILRSISSCLKDERHPSYIDHSYEDMLTQRVFQIASGYEDANDCNTLRNDNIFKLCSN